MDTRLPTASTVSSSVPTLLPASFSVYSPTGVNVNDLPLPMESFTRTSLWNTAAKAGSMTMTSVSARAKAMALVVFCINNASCKKYLLHNIDTSGKAGAEQLNGVCGAANGIYAYTHIRKAFPENVFPVAGRVHPGIKYQF